jgi:hypothetical protein
MDSLAAHFRDLEGDVGNYLGFGRGLANGDSLWSDRQQRAITQCVKGGMRRFYYFGIRWSFLQPMGSVTLASGESAAFLPLDFGAAEGPIIVSSDDRRVCTVPFGPVGVVYSRLASLGDSTGYPIVACEEPIREQVKSRSPRKQIKVAPIADQAYTLQFQYHVNPEYLDGHHPYAYGGQQHAETLLAACKATAEIDLDRETNGPQFREFMRLMQGSVEVDARNQPQTLGYNADRSDQRYETDWRRDELVTIAGMTP